MTVKQCYLATISTKTPMKEVQFIKEKHEVLKDIRRDSKAKVVEDLIRYELDNQVRIVSFSLVQTWRNERELNSFSSL